MDLNMPYTFLSDVAARTDYIFNTSVLFPVWSRYLSPTLHPYIHQG